MSERQSADDIKKLYDDYVMNTYKRNPIVLVKGKGTMVWDEDGKGYLDFLGGIAVNPLGHCPPEIVNAIIAQSQELMHTSNLYYTKPGAELAELLVLNGGLDKVFFCNSGAEANEGAFKLARKYQWRKGLKDKYKIISAQHSFHGRTLAALAATAKAEIQEGFGPLPKGFEYIEWNNVDSLTSAIDEDTAAVIIEPIQGEGGIHCAKPEFLEKIKLSCEQAGALLIFDEVQCGLGRTGDFFAYKTFKIKPDIITLAKGIANGLPFGAICARNEVAAAFHPGDHGTTFGGNLVASAAALATLKLLISEDYPAKVKKLGTYLINQLNKLKIKFPDAIYEIRGRGLMIGIEFKIDASALVDHCRALGLLTNMTARNVLRLLPPYIITERKLILQSKLLKKQ